MRHDPYGYVIIEYNGSTIPTFNISTYSSGCGLIDNSISRIMLAQFSTNNMIDVAVRYDGSVREVNSMSCSGDKNIVIMGGFARDMELWYIVLAYIPLISMMLISAYYFVKKKIIIKKMVEHSR